LFGKTVKVYEVDIASEHVTEQALKSEKEQTIRKVIRVFAQTILVIPATLLGLLLKKIAIVGKTTDKKYTILFQHIKFYQSMNAPPKSDPSQLKVQPKSGNTPLVVGQNQLALKERKASFENLPKELLLKIFSDLSPNEIIRCRGVSKVCWNAISKPSLFAFEYLKKMKGLPKNEEKYKDYSFCSLTLDIREYREKYHYTPKLVELFDGSHNLLKIPLKLINEGKPCAFYQEVENLAHSPQFCNIPSIMRLRINVYNGLKTKENFNEFIVIKYTLFIPKESDPDLHNDTIWHDYLLLKYEYSGNPEWTINDPRDPDHLPQVFSRKNGPYEFPYTPYPPLFSGFSESIKSPRLKKLLQGQPIELFGTNRLRVPKFILRDQNRDSNLKRVYRDIPAVIGHVTVEEIKSLLREEFIPNSVVEPDGTVKIINRDGPTQVITF
jgi:hypothetical protein